MPAKFPQKKEELLLIVTLAHSHTVQPGFSGKAGKPYRDTSGDSREISNYLVNF